MNEGRNYSLRAPNGQVYEGTNLSEFIRTHLDLFDPTKISYPIGQSKVYRSLQRVVGRYQSMHRRLSTGEVYYKPVEYWEGWTRSGSNYTPPSRKPAPRLPDEAIKSIKSTCRSLTTVSRSVSGRNYWKDPSRRAQMSAAMKRNWASGLRKPHSFHPFRDPAVRAKGHAACRTPEARKKLSAACKLSWQDPQKRAARIRGMLGVPKKKRIWHPQLN